MGVKLLQLKLHWTILTTGLQFNISSLLEQIGLKKHAYVPYDEKCRNMVKFVLDEASKQFGYLEIRGEPGAIKDLSFKFPEIEPSSIDLLFDPNGFSKLIRELVVGQIDMEKYFKIMSLTGERLPKTLLSDEITDKLIASIREAQNYTIYQNYRPYSIIAGHYNTEFEWFAPAEFKLTNTRSVKVAARAVFTRLLASSTTERYIDDPVSDAIYVTTYAFKDLGAKVIVSCLKAHKIVLTPRQLDIFIDSLNIYCGHSLFEIFKAISYCLLPAVIEYNEDEPEENDYEKAVAFFDINSLEKVCLKEEPDLRIRDAVAPKVISDVLEDMSVVYGVVESVGIDATIRRLRENACHTENRPEEIDGTELTEAFDYVIKCASEYIDSLKLLRCATANIKNPAAPNNEERISLIDYLVNEADIGVVIEKYLEESKTEGLQEIIKALENNILNKYDTDTTESIAQCLFTQCDFKISTILRIMRLAIIN